jgi:Flp pilus assembly pilin Flp
MKRVGAGRTGQGLAEYALVLALLAIVAIAAILLLGGGLDIVLSTIGASPSPR